MKKIYLLILSGFSILPGKSQNLTGTWEGLMGHEYLQVNIIDNGSTLCGYTYDYFVENKSQYCRAWFSARYNKESDQWIFTGTKFISNAGSHSLMRLKLREIKDGKETVLAGTAGLKSTFATILTLGINSYVELKRVSKKPRPLPEDIPICYTESAHPTPDTPSTVIPEITKDTLVTKNPEVIQIDTPEYTIPEKPDYTTRENKSISTLQVNVKKIKLAVYDNGVVDGDTVSIYLNNKLLVNRKMLSETPIELDIELDENLPRNELLLFAENLGKIPPNTAIIIVTAGKKRYELLSGQNLQQNSVLFFEYRPD